VTIRELAASFPKLIGWESWRTASQGSSTSPELVRALGVWTSMSIVVGVMIGSGIFLKPAEIAQGTGSVAWALGAWVVAAGLSLLGAFCYLEMGTALPQAAANYAFLRRAFGPGVGFVYGWRSVVISGPASHASQAAAIMLFAHYYWPELANPVLSVPIPSLMGLGGFDLTLTGARLGAAMFIIAFALLSLAGVKAAGRTLLCVTIVKVLALAAIVVAPFVLGRGATGSWSNLTGSGSGIGGAITFTGFMMAVYAALWAFSGSSGLLRMAGEIKDPSRTMPAATLWGFGLTTALYLLLTVACFYVLGFDGVAGSSHVVSDMLEHVGGPVLAGLVTVLMIVSAFGSMTGSAVRVGRLPYAMARDGLFPRAMGRVHPSTRVPVWAIIISRFMALVLALTGSFAQLTGLSVFISWAFFGLMMLALFKLRVTEPDLPRPVKTLGYPIVPAVALIGAAILTVSVVLQYPGRSLLSAVAVATGIPVYLVARRRLVRAESSGLSG